MNLGWHNSADQAAAMARKAAPEVEALQVGGEYRVWCAHCQQFHVHEFARYYAKPCVKADSPYNLTGYNVRCDPSSARRVAKAQREAAALAAPQKSPAKHPAVSKPARPKKDQAAG